VGCAVSLKDSFMKSWLIAAFAAGALSLGLDDQAAAQGCGPSNPNCIVPTRPVGDSTNAAASTAFVTGAIATIPAAIGTLVSVNVYSGSQTITIPAGATRASVRMWGATGGSGGIGSQASGCASGATGGAGYLEKYLTGLTAGNTLVFTQGAAGTAGTSGGGNGGNGGASTLASGTQTISTLTANGSNGSTGNNTNGTTTNGTIGGTASGGDINISGSNGLPPTVVGFGASASTVALIVGVTGSARSFGAQGAIAASSASAGNAGAPGGIIVEWYT
jgi:hypothetical protein